MKQLTACDIIQLLRKPTELEQEELQEYFERTGRIHPSHGFLTKRRIIKEASVRTLLATLSSNSDPHIREILCDIFGERRAKSAVPQLIDLLDDKDVGVRAAAADALGKIGSRKAGEAMLKRFLEETEVPVKDTLVAALGAVGYHPAVPALIEALNSPERTIRACAAWSLGALHAHEAVLALRNALAQETNISVRERIESAIEEIDTL